MAVQLNLTMNCTVIETLATGVDGIPSGAARNVTHSAFNFSPGAKDASSTPSVTQVSSDTIALVAGAKTVDLTALPLVNGATLDATGLKIVAILFSNASASTGAMTFAKGASNGYTGLGANFSIAVPPGGCVEAYTAKHSSVAAVSGTVKTIDVAGTGTESFNIIIVLG